MVQLHGVVSTMSSPDEKMEPVLDEEVRCREKTMGWLKENH